MSGPVDQSGASVWNRGTGAAVDQLPALVAVIWPPYHYSYGVEPHKRKQPCTESADPQHTCTLGFSFLAVLKFANVEGRV
ncbi:hypothetical protein T10_6741 [Trichinella papuae]|uniref:Uncharacterized protein n=1 Tax=Trichinella papuae TaxID=268474 RepID=A0A0V1LWX1_9BILA|nr:hypothetical protein T10_6741 [Trichinella papuae]